METIKARIIPTLSDIIDAEESILAKIKLFINVYNDLIMDNPMIPGFLFMEFIFNHNEEDFYNFMTSRKKPDINNFMINSSTYIQ